MRRAKPILQVSWAALGVIGGVVRPNGGIRTSDKPTWTGFHATARYLGVAVDSVGPAEKLCVQRREWAKRWKGQVQRGGQRWAGERAAGWSSPVRSVTVSGEW
jgi:hypothetical protein